MNRYHRTPAPAGPPWGYADLPAELAGEVLHADTLEPSHRARCSPAQLAMLTRPWRGHQAHPRLVTARQVLADAPLELELGLRAAHALVDLYALHNALAIADRR